MTIGLAMLVRDEADTLPTTLPPMLEIVNDCTIIDTGSVDNTLDVIRDLTSRDPIRKPWVNFAVNRTELLREAAARADYTLMLDADHRISVHGPRPKLDADSYLLPVNSGSLTWRLPLLTRSQHPFEYRGAAHSYLASDLPARSEPTDWITVDGGPGASRDKLERDLDTLTRAFTQHPEDARTVFYLARTHDDLDQHHQAIAYYRLRANMGGWQQETFYARYRLGCLLSEHVSFADGAAELLAAWNSQRDRIEPLRALANAANAVADKTPKPDDGLFVTPSAYRQEAAV